MVTSDSWPKIALPYPLPPITVDETIPPDELRLVDPATGRVLAILRVTPSEAEEPRARYSSSLLDEPRFWAAVAMAVVSTLLLAVGWVVAGLLIVGVACLVWVVT